MDLHTDSYDEELPDPASRVRDRRVALAIAFVVFGIVAALGAQAGLSQSGPDSAVPSLALTGSAVGAQVIRPGAETQKVAAATPVSGGVEHATGATPAWSLDGIAQVDRLTTDATLSRAASSTKAQVNTGSISLLNGRVTITGARLVARAGIASGTASSSLQLSSATKLVVDGVTRPATVNQRVAIQGVGVLIVNEQAVLAAAPRGDAQTGPRTRIVGAIAHLRITQTTAGLPAGSEVLIGRVDTGVRQGKIRAITHPAPGPLAIPSVPSGAVPGLQRGVPAPGTGSLPRQATSVRGSAAASVVRGNLQGYLFPVLGSANYSNDWGAARASTGVPHQGNDIFAAEGTPIVALTDGVLDRVGWNSIGGYRFWLYDQYGNSFYHAHLSAFSPLAQDGARVRRGDVIGFVGHTGDAQGTPPHLHFEIHPGNGAATNPFTFLNAWRRGVAVAIGLIAGADHRSVPLALLGFSDITANSGLEGSVLDSVPDTAPRPVEQETAPQPTDDTLKGAIEGPGTTPR